MSTSCREEVRVDGRVKELNLFLFIYWLLWEKWQKRYFLKICLNWFYIKIKFIKEGGDNKSGVFFLLVTASCVLLNDFSFSLMFEFSLQMHLIIHIYKEAGTLCNQPSHCSLSAAAHHWSFSSTMFPCFYAAQKRNSRWYCPRERRKTAFETNTQSSAWKCTRKSQASTHSGLGQHCWRHCGDTGYNWLVT